MRSAIISLVRDSAKVSLDLFKVMVPVIVAVKILKDLGLISWLAAPLAPVMEFVGLPGSMGLVWATGLLNNIYSAMIVFVSLAPDAGLSVAQVTVLCTMLLIAHGLPVELKIAEKCGPAILPQALFRVGGALVLGFLMNQFYTRTDWLSRPNRIFWTPDAEPSGWWEWAMHEAGNLLSIFLIILALMTMMRVLNKIRATDVMNRVLRPVLRLMGIGPAASTITVVGLALGLSYGSGLIIHEARTGRVGPRDVFASVTLMGLCHSLIEDTMLMVMLGADFSGVFWPRLVFALAVMAVVVRMTNRMADKAFARTFLRGGAMPAPPAPERT